MVVLFLLSAACISLALLYYAITKNHDFWEKRNVPHEKPFLFFGNMYPVASKKKHMMQLLIGLYEKFQTAPYFGMFMFHQPSLVIKDPELVKQVLVKDFDKFADRNFAPDEKIDPVGYHALFSSRGSVWKAVRSKISPVFTSGRMKLMLPLMQECADDLTSCLAQANGTNLEFRHLIKKYGTDVISSTAFGIRANCLKNEDSEMFTMATQLSDLTSFKRNFAFTCFFLWPKLANVLRLTLMEPVAQDYLIKVFNGAFKERQRNGVVRHDLIDLLNGLKKNEKLKDDYKFDDIKMAAQALIFFTGGIDTTTFTISYALYEVALQSNIQQRLKAEVKAAYEKHGGFTYEALQEMKYLDMIFNETSRKWPLTTFLRREATTDYTFEKTGLKLEKGAFIMVPVAGLHFDPEYFPDPYSFIPERFSDENKSNIKPYTYLPFGDGPRVCLGQRFAQQASKIAIAQIMKDFTLHVTSETDVPIRISPKTLRLINDGGIFLKVTKD